MQTGSNSQSSGSNGQCAEKHRTAQTELAACIYLLGEGYEVFRNVSAHGTADLVAVKGDRVLRIDVKSGRDGGKLTAMQEREGIVLLHVDESGHCELGPDRKQRIDKVLQETLAEVAGMSPKDGAAHLNQRGITTPNGRQWVPGTVVMMRQRLALAE